jgi:hypothetical protein
MTCPQAAAEYLVEAQSQQAQVYLHILHSHPCSCTKNTLQCIALHTSGGNRFILPEGLGWFSLYLSLLIPLSMLYQWTGNHILTMLSKRSTIAEDLDIDDVCLCSQNSAHRDPWSMMYASLLVSYSLKDAISTQDGFTCSTHIKYICPHGLEERSNLGMSKVPANWAPWQSKHCNQGPHGSLGLVTNNGIPSQYIWIEEMPELMPLISRLRHSCVSSMTIKWVHI